MAEFTDYLENELLDHILGTGSWTMPAAVHLALHTAVNSDSAPGTEVSGSGYGRASTAFDAAAAGTASNSTAESFTATGGNFGTVVSTSLYDAATVGNQLMFDNDFTDTAVNDGNTLEFAIGAIDVSLT